MPTLEESSAAVRGAVKEDRFTYLTILEYHVETPGILPVLNQILQDDEELTEDIGWDLIDMLLPIEGHEECLETVARFGSPKEVYLRLTQSLGSLAEAWLQEDDNGDGGSGEAHDPTFSHNLTLFWRTGEAHRYQKRAPLPKDKIPGAFITLLGMLAVVHQRLRAKFPSRYLGPALVQVLRAYRSTPEMTASVINLMRTLSGRKRPPLPARTSSISVANPDEDGDSSRNAPDPEAELEEPEEDVKQRRLLQSFVTYILFWYVNDNEMRWSARLLEKYYPERCVPGRKTNIDAYQDEQDRQKRDGVVGHLVALALDLGIHESEESFVWLITETPAEPDADKLLDDFHNASADVQLSLGGLICLIAYWMFSVDVFGAQHPNPKMYIFPHHLNWLEKFLRQDPPEEIGSKHVGITDALLAIGLALHHRDLIVAPPAKGNGKGKGEEPIINTMAYHHHLSLILVFHPDIQVRNAATVFAGKVFHAEKSDAKRFEILEDLFANCDYASLKACAVQWLKEEIIEAVKSKTKSLELEAKSESESGEKNATTTTSSPSSHFTSPESLDRLQHYVFPDLRFLTEEDQEKGNNNPQAILEYWAIHGIFLLQAANFAYFLFAGSGAYRDIVPPGMGAAVEHRFAEPLIGAAGIIRQGWGWDDEKATFAFAIDRLCDIPFH